MYLILHINSKFIASIRKELVLQRKSITTRMLSTTRRLLR